MSQSTLLDALQSSITTLVESANALSARVAASTEQTSNKLVHEAVEASTDPDVVKFREWKEKALAQIAAKEAVVYEAVRASLKTDAKPMTDEEIEAAKQEHSALRAKYRAALTFVEMQPDYTEEWKANLPEFKSFRGGKTAATGKTGIERPRIADASIDGVPYTATKKDKDGKLSQTISFTALAAEVQRREREAGNKECKVAASELFAAAKETAKAEGHANWNDATVIEFAYAGKEHNYMLTVHPAVKSAE